MKVISREDALDCGLRFYFTGKRCIRGHLSERYTSNKQCKLCRAEKDKEYSAANKEKIKEKNKCRYEENKEDRKKKQREYNKLNKDKISEKKKEYYIKNRENIRIKNIEFRRNNPLKIKEYDKNRYDRDKEKRALYGCHYRLKNKEKIREKKLSFYIENRDKILAQKRLYYKSNKDKILNRNRGWAINNVTSVLARNTINRLVSMYKISDVNYEEMLGYSSMELRNHLESKFDNGMNWDNRAEWHIDHIIPIKQFIDNGIYELKIINSLMNLQPLWAKDNQSKGCLFVSDYEFDLYTSMFE